MYIKFNTWKFNEKLSKLTSFRLDRAPLAAGLRECLAAFLLTSIIRSLNFDQNSYVAALGSRAFEIPAQCLLYEVASIISGTGPDICTAVVVARFKGRG
jgi:hypothetical protein